MSVLDLLLETDIEKIKANNKKDYEIKRLSKAIGEKFLVTCYPLSNEQISHIGEVSKNNADTKINAVLESCRIDGKRLNSKELMDKFDAVTPNDMLNKLFLPGEIFELYNAVNELSGYGRDAVREIKN